jgi:hypothetical protein
MTVGRIFAWIQFLIRFRNPIVLISIFFIAIFELLGSILNLQVWNVISLLSLIPFLLLTFYCGLLVFYLHSQNKKWLIITMLIVSMMLVFTLPTEDTSIFLRPIQTLLFIPIIVGWIYLFVIAIASQPEESFPTFRKIFKLPKKLFK